MTKVSIITVNKNNCTGLIKTIESVFEQSLFDYEYIIIDGGSADGSRELLSTYKEHITYALSEKDNGIYDAMNKGIDLATGEYLQFLNSGDYLYEKETISKIVSELSGEDIIYGNMKISDKEGITDGLMPDEITVEQMVRDTLWHPVSFIKKELFLNFGKYDTSYKIIADYDFFFKAIIKEKCTTKHVDQFISVFDLTGLSSDIKNVSLIKTEREKVQEKYLSADYLKSLKQPKRKEGFISSIKKWFQ